MEREVQYITEEECVLDENDESPLGVTCNFGGNVFTSDRDWLVNGYLDVGENREVAKYSTDIAAALEVWKSPRQAGTRCLYRYEWGLLRPVLHRRDIRDGRSPHRPPRHLYRRTFGRREGVPDGRRDIHSA